MAIRVVALALVWVAFGGWWAIKVAGGFSDLWYPEEFPYIVSGHALLAVWVVDRLFFATSESSGVDASTT